MDNYSRLLVAKCQGELANSEDEKQPSTKRNVPYTKGVAMSFGFKKPSLSTQPSVHNRNVGRRLATTDIIDRNGNEDTYPVVKNSAPSGRTTPRLPAPKKEANAVRAVSRFGFRQPTVNRFNRISDVNLPAPRHIEYSNNNFNDPKPQTEFRRDDIPRPKPVKLSSITQPKVPEIGRYTLQSSQLPKPQLPERVIETKAAKTLANNSRKFSNKYHTYNNMDMESSSKEGSVTGDSGVGSHSSGGVDLDSISNIKLLQSSPHSGRKPRALGVVISGNKFDVRDLDDNTHANIALPALPTTTFQNNQGISGFVRERASEYQRRLDTRQRRLSVTSSEGCFSDDYIEEERSNSKFLNERSFKQTFLKPQYTFKANSLTSSSDEHEWAAGEAMAEEISCSFSSSDESRDKTQTFEDADVLQTEIVLKNLMISTVKRLVPKNEVQKVLLTIEDPKFAAVAEASTSSTLLEDETSPTDSFMCYSESDECIKNKLNSNSKEVNEKLSPSSPCSPTNASNSLSLSDASKDFFVDDEIADQPALVFDDTLTACLSDSTLNVTLMNSDNSIVANSVQKPARKVFRAFEESPRLRARKLMGGNHGGSVDTLSPCESITSDDLMLDFEYSQSSGVEDFDREISRSEVTVRKSDWPIAVENTTNRMMRTSRLLTSRARTPISVPDSPRSLDSRINVRTRPLTHSPLRQSRGSGSAGYDSDDSIKFERTNNIAMSQDVMSIKTMLLKLKRVLLESETHNPFENQNFLRNGLFSSQNSNLGCDEVANAEDSVTTKLQLADLKRQVLFLQGQLEDKDKTVQALQNQIVKYVSDCETANSAPASTVCESTNAATQTERVRPVSAGPSLFQDTSAEPGAFVSVSESSSRKSHPSSHTEPPLSNPETRRMPSRLWRRPGEPPSPQRYCPSSSIPRRTNSRTRGPSTPS